ncbi:TIGR02646 family protein [Bradyrhizobium sp. 44]|uniref:retron system putative HNH endonuclease n=1 Tax=Bradyrhizobium sp. 44 TaxID=2782675 RepID=UPI001FFA2479|nr:retron system putative HNH endonuclease [Bradyrhizobium sp. 44]MCK1284092.1 TIGR02646 family protein [Bradyrhizobium sp. 44]
MIIKGAEPNRLTQHRKQAHSDYNNYAQKDELRAALVGEQKGLCCYCTGRIRAESAAMKIEHWQCQATYPQQQLVYGNLLGACLGGDGKSPAERHCDTRKGSRDLKWNPANIAHVIESRVRYLSNGAVESADAEFNIQINDVLGLNLSYLKSSRKAVLDSVLNWWRSTPNARQKVQQQIDHRTNAAEHQPFSPVAVWFLRQKLGGATA